MNRFQVPTGHQDEGENPFWISYSDLMTALMILFLVVMVVSLTSLSQQSIAIKSQMQQIQEKDETESVQVVKVQEPEPVEPEVDPLEAMQLQRLKEIKNFCDELNYSSAIKGVSARVDCNKSTIDLGEAGRFAQGEYVLSKNGQNTLRQLVPLVLKAAKSPNGGKWLKRVHIQGFTDVDGSYLFNLNLSLRRSEWVMCQILRTRGPDTMGLTADQRMLAKQLFLAGGVAFNNQLESKEASRRVELKLEFYGLGGEGSQGSASDRLLFSDHPNEECQI